MDLIVSRIIAYFLRLELIDQDSIPWVEYGIKRRIATIVGMVPFLAISIIITGVRETLAFWGSFFVLRRYCNGYHANKLSSCIALSTIIELFFLIILRNILTPVGCVIINISSALLILMSAPYNHPKMHYTSSELVALRKRIRRNVFVLELLFVCAIAIRCQTAARGLTMGIAMTALLLQLAYVAERRTNETYKQKTVQDSEMLY